MIKLRCSANLLAFIITLVARSAIDGCVPIFIFSANSPGTGKSLSLRLCVMIALGIVEGAVFAPVEDDAEMRKRLTSALRTGLPVITIDNVVRLLDSPALNAFVTTREWNDRLLGGNELASMANNSVVTVTGNNVRVGDDGLRRSCLVQMNAPKENPWEGRNFKIGNIQQWVQERRSQLLAAVLLLVRAWFKGGCLVPKEFRALGGFEEWNRIVAGVLHIAGVEGFMANTGKLTAMNDGDSVQWAPLLNAWFNAYLDAPVTVARICKDAVVDRYDASSSVLNESLPAHLAQYAGDAGKLRYKLGNALKAIVDTPCNGFHVEAAGIDKTTNTKLWRVRVKDISVLPEYVQEALRMVTWLREVGHEPTAEHVKRLTCPLTTSLLKMPSLPLNRAELTVELLTPWLEKIDIRGPEAVVLCAELRGDGLQNGK